MAKYTVLTFIFGKNYEKLHEVQEPAPDVEYLLVTDDDTLVSSTWKVIVDHDYDGMSGFEKCFRTRYNVFKYATTDICITIDGSVGCKAFPYKLLDEFERGTYDICLMPHPLWADFISEYNAWIRMRNYPVENAKRFFAFLADAKYDVRYKGLFQLCFSIKRRGKTTDDIDRMTFALLKYLSSPTEFERLDQTVFSFVMNRYFNNLKVLPVSEQIYHDNPYFQWYWHGSDKPNNNIWYDAAKPDIKSIFNKDVECFYLLA